MFLAAVEQGVGPSLVLELSADNGQRDNITSPIITGCTGLQSSWAAYHYTMPRCSFTIDGTYS